MRCVVQSLHSGKLTESRGNMTEEVKIFIEFDLNGDIDEFEAIFREIIALSDDEGADLRYEFYRSPEHPRRIFAIEQHPGAEALAAHFRRTFPLLQKAWACARPVQTLIFGNLPPAMKAQMQQNGATVVPWWIGN